MATGKDRCEFMPISQPGHEHEEAALRTIHDLLNTSDFKACYLISGFYLERNQGGRSGETDALIVCDYGVYIVEHKDWSGSISILNTSGPKIICTFPGKISEERKNPIGGIRFHIRAMQDQLKPISGKFRITIPTYGLLVFSDKAKELKVVNSFGIEVKNTAVNEVGICRENQVVQAMKEVATMVSRNAAPSTLQPAQVKMIAEHLAGTLRKRPGYPLRVGTLILEHPIEPWSSQAEYRLYSGKRDTGLPVIIQELEIVEIGVAKQNEARDFMLRAAQALERIESHPNVIKYYAHEVSDNQQQLYLAFKLLSAKALRDYDTTSWSIAQKLLFIRDIAGALAFIHENSLLHRAVNPDNILVSIEEQTPVLANFELSKVADASYTVFHRVQSQPHQEYIAPEILRAVSSRPEDLDPRCDVYSLGIVAYELLTGELPFKSEEERSNKGGYPPISSVLGVSQSLSDFLDRMMAHITRRRPTAKEVAATIDLEAQSHA